MQAIDELELESVWEVCRSQFRSDMIEINVPMSEGAIHMAVRD